VEDIKSRKDFFGKQLLITKRTNADNLVYAAQGKADESMPAVLNQGCSGCIYRWH
jgi:F420-0:gamma-glutamyl ligase